MPVGFRYDAEHDAIEVGGHRMAATKKYRDARRSGRAAIVVDDVASVDPWRVRGVEIRGPVEAVGGERPVLRIRPERVVSWGLEGPPPARGAA